MSKSFNPFAFAVVDEKKSDMGSLPVVISPLELGLNNSEQKFGDYKIGYYKKFGSGVKWD